MISILLCSIVGLIPVKNFDIDPSSASLSIRSKISADFVETRQRIDGSLSHFVPGFRFRPSQRGFARGPVARLKVIPREMGTFFVFIPRRGQKLRAQNLHFDSRPFGLEYRNPRDAHLLSRPRPVSKINQELEVVPKKANIDKEPQKTNNSELQFQSVPRFNLNGIAVFLVFLGLALVAVWTFRRKMSPQQPKAKLRIVASQSLSRTSRIVVVEYEDIQWVLSADSKSVELLSERAISSPPTSYQQSANDVVEPYDWGAPNEGLKDLSGVIRLRRNAASGSQVRSLA